MNATTLVNPATATTSSTQLARVLYVQMLDPKDKFGSMEEQACFLAQAFQKEGGLFMLLFSCYPSPGKTRQFEERQIPCVCLNLNRFRFATLRSLLRLIAENNIEVVHWNFTNPLRNAYLWYLTLCAPKVKHFFTDHVSRFTPHGTTASFPVRPIKSLLLRRYAKVFCVSRYVEHRLRQQQCWHHLHVVRHFVNTDRFKPDAAVRERMRRELGVEDKFVVVAVAHLIYEKGADVLLRAVVTLPDHVECWFLGEGRDEESLRRLKDELKLGHRVRFLGHQRNIEPYLQAADCAACPSVWYEAAGLVNIEAQAAQLPIVASRIGGIPEYIDDQMTGMLFEPGGHEELARCLRRLIEDPELQREMGKNAREMVLERFSPQRMLDTFLALYRTT